MSTFDYIYVVTLTFVAFVFFLVCIKGIKDNEKKQDEVIHYINSIQLCSTKEPITNEKGEEFALLCIPKNPTK